MDKFKELIPWFITLVFGAGIVYQTMLGSASAVADVSERLEAHEALKSHPVTEERINTILIEQRAIRVEQSEMARAVAAICQATDARCR